MFQVSINNWLLDVLWIVVLNGKFCMLLVNLTRAQPTVVYVHNNNDNNDYYSCKGLASQTETVI